MKIREAYSKIRKFIDEGSDNRLVLVLIGLAAAGVLSISALIFAISKWGFGTTFGLILGIVFIPYAVKSFRLWLPRLGRALTEVEPPAKSRKSVATTVVTASPPQSRVTTKSNARATRTCPSCGEDVLVAAIKCRFCGELLPKRAEDMSGAERVERSIFAFFNAFMALAVLVVIISGAIYLYVSNDVSQKEEEHVQSMIEKVQGKWTNTELDRQISIEDLGKSMGYHSIKIYIHGRPVINSDYFQPTAKFMIEKAEDNELQGKYDDHATMRDIMSGTITLEPDGTMKIEVGDNWVDGTYRRSESQPTSP